MLWDIFQSMHLHRQDERTGSLEQRVAYLELQLSRTNEMLERVVKHIERRDGRDLDEDGRIG
jgi:hypothetical protein